MSECEQCEWVSAPLVEEAPGESNRRNTWRIKERVTNIRIEVSTFMMRVPYIDAGFTYTIPLSAVGRSPPQGLQPLHPNDRYVSGTWGFVRHLSLRASLN